jgi:type IV secretion system protein TrbL
MNDIGVIDRFTAVFLQYIDSGFGLLGPEVHFLTATLVVIDITLAGLFWAMGGEEDVIAKLIKKTLYVGAFAYIINNFNALAGIIFKSFAGLGLTASAATITQAQFLQPGRLAGVGIDAARPIMISIGQLTGFPDVFANLDSIVVLLLAWLIVIVSFFVLAVQLFVTLIEFKLTTLAGFVLVPFALWNKTAFLAERVLGNVISSGIKVLVLAVIVGIGTGIFGEFTTPNSNDMTIDNALAIVLASLALFGLGLFGPGIATGLVSGAPQLGAGAAAGTMMGVGGLAMASGTAMMSSARLATTASRATMNTATTLTRTARAAGTAYQEGASQSGLSGSSRVMAGMRHALSSVSSAAATASRTNDSNAGSSSGESGDATASMPAWARRAQRRQRFSTGVSTSLHAVRSADHAGSGASPSLHQDHS